MNAPPDIAWSRQLSGTSTGQVTLWAAAAFLILSTHVAAAWWMMRQPPDAPADAATQAAIMIDLSPETVAPEAFEEEIAMDAEDSAGVEAPPSLQPVETSDVAKPVMEESEPVVQDVPLETVQPVSEPERMAAVEPEALKPIEPEPVEPVKPETETLQEVVDPIDEMIAEQLDNVEVPLPAARPEVREARAEPKPERPRPPKTRPTPKKQQNAPSPETRKGAVQAERADRAAAQQTSRGATASISPARWQSRLLAHLERRKRYPASSRRAREQGTAYVRFSIDANGNVASVSLARSSGSPALDQEVVAMVRRASPVPAPPPGVNRTIMVPVRFSLR